MAFDEGVSLLCVVDIGFGEVLQTTQMVEGVIAHLMTLVPYLLIQFGMLTHIVAHHEKGGAGVVFTKRLEDERGRLGYRTIIERQIYRTLVLVHAPDGSRKHPSQPERGLLNNHDSCFKK